LHSSSIHLLFNADPVAVCLEDFLLWMTITSIEYFKNYSRVFVAKNKLEIRNKFQLEIFTGSTTPMAWCNEDTLLIPVCPG